MNVTSMTNERKMQLDDTNLQNVYSFLLVTIQEHLPKMFVRENDLAIYHDSLRVNPDNLQRDGIVITTHYYIEPKRPGRPVQTYPNLAFMCFKGVQVTHNRIVLYGGCSDHEQGKQEFEKLWQIFATAYQTQDQSSPAVSEAEDPTYREEFILACDKREFRSWFERQYPAHASYYKDTPTGAAFSIGLIRIQMDYSLDAGRHKYVFEITEPVAFSKIRNDFIGTVRNTFETYSPSAAMSTLPSQGPVNPLQADTPQLEKPCPPGPRSPVNAWLDHYHAVKKAGYKITFKMLADESGYAESTFKQAHGLYLQERENHIPDN